MKNEGKNNKITNAYEAAMCFDSIWNRHDCLNSQSTYAIFLDTQHEYYAHILVSYEGLKDAPCDLRKVLKFAQDNKIAYVILGRNATQTAPEPNKQDIGTAMLLTSICKPEGITLIDYLIVSFPDNKTDYFSLREAGLIV